jgi:protease I
MTEPRRAHPERIDGAEFLSTEPAGLTERPPEARPAEGALSGKRVAVLIHDGFEQTEFEVPVRTLRAAGARVEVVAPDAAHLDRIKGESQGEPAAGTKGDRVLAETRPSDYDALLIPGGLKSPDSMRQSDAHLAFVRAFVEAGKPIGAICHGPWLLADVDALRGRTVTSWPAIKRDLECRGAEWIDQEVVRDGPFVFSRKPDDAEAFGRALVELLATRSAGSPRSERGH